MTFQVAICGAFAAGNGNVQLRIGMAGTDRNGANSDSVILAVPREEVRLLQRSSDGVVFLYCSGLRGDWRRDTEREV